MPDQLSQQGRPESCAGVSATSSTPHGAVRKPVGHRDTYDDPRPRHPAQVELSHKTRTAIVALRVPLTYNRGMKIGCAVARPTSRTSLPGSTLQRLGVEPAHIYTDLGHRHQRNRPGLQQALAAASRPGDELVVTASTASARSV